MEILRQRLSDCRRQVGVPNYLGKMIRSFAYRRDRLVLTVSGEGLAGALGIDRLASEWPSNGPAGGDYSMTVPLATKRRGPQMKLVVGTTNSTTPNRSLVTAVVRGWDWANRLRTGEVGSMAELCAKEGVTDSYVSQLLPLAFLSPATVEDILSGRQDAALTADRLIWRENVPHLWWE